MAIKDTALKVNEVQENLINTSLVVACISAPILMTFSLIRSFQMNEFGMLFINSISLISLLLITIFRKKVLYKLKAIFFITILLTIATSDLFNIGYMSMAYIWFVAAAILGVLYFNLRSALIVIVISIFILFAVFLLKNFGFHFKSYDFDTYAQSEIVLILRTTSFLVVSLMVIFSIRHITSEFQKNIDVQWKQKLNLLNAAIRMRREIDYRKKSEQVAQESENKFKNIFENSSDPMAIIGQDGNFINFNLAFVELSEVSAEELFTINFMEIVPKDYMEFFEKLKSNFDLIPPRFDLTYTSDLSGEIKYLDVTTTLVEYESRNSVLVICRDNTEKIGRERIIYSAALEAEEKERLRLSKELHDGLGPLLSTLKIYFETLEKRPNDEEIQRRIKLILNDSISSVKEISNNLSPYALQNLGVVKALKSFIDKINFTGALRVEFQSNISDRLDEKIEITIYRLVTEMLHNTLKHANAKQAIISVLMEGSLLKIEYIDNGIGFDLTNSDFKAKGIGLFNMQSRIEKMGGKCTFHSEIGEGFNANVVIDLT